MLDAKHRSCNSCTSKHSTKVNGSQDKMTFPAYTEMCRQMRGEAATQHHTFLTDAGRGAKVDFYRKVGSGPGEGESGGEQR